MQRTTGSQATLSPAAQQANAERDGSVSPCIREAAAKMAAADRAISEAREAVARLAVHSDPPQKTAVGKTEEQVVRAGLDFHSARRSLQDAIPKYGQTLARDGKSQFNAAARGDARSIIPQVARQQRPAERLPGTVSPQLYAAAMSAGQVGQPVAAVLQQGPGSQQVADDQPKPQPRPTRQFAAGADATAHRKAMSADATRAADRNAALRKLAEGLNKDHGHAAGASQEFTPG
jgi:hypothetical protein